MGNESKASRIFSLDTLRGVAIFGMILSGLIPWSGLPAWMYHCQVPPPDHKFNPNLPGITWVDLVFPFFMFSMGAAIPLALTRRLEKGEPFWRIIGHILWRGLVLARSLVIPAKAGIQFLLICADSPSSAVWFRSLLGFCCWVLFLVRLDALNLPIDFKSRPWLRYLLRAIGVSGLILLMYTLQWKDGSGFALNRNDIIILLLAFAYTAGSLLWLISRNNLMFRLAIIAGIFAFRLHNTAGGVLISTLDNWLDPVSWLFSPGWIQLTLVTLPGTIIGEILLNWSKRAEPESNNHLGLSGLTISAILISLVAIVVGGLIYLYTRWVYTGFFFTVCLSLLVYMLLRKSKTPVANLLQTIFNWGFFLLIIGYILEPYEGGIKKNPTTPAYYFVSMGMGIAVLIVFYIIIDIYQKGWTVGFLRVVGSNPMLAYIMGSGFVYPLLHITHLIDPIDKLVANNVPFGTIWAVLLTCIVCAVVYLFSRLKIFVRI
ncbi:MAG: DUF5009 domain-containing protein [bacterium]|nr:DUF5009 domain-containing protein [bacterium]